MTEKLPTNEEMTIPIAEEDARIGRWGDEAPEEAMAALEEEMPVLPYDLSPAS